MIVGEQHFPDNCPAGHLEKTIVVRQKTINQTYFVANFWWADGSSVYNASIGLVSVCFCRNWRNISSTNIFPFLSLLPHSWNNIRHSTNWLFRTQKNRLRTVLGTRGSQSSRQSTNRMTFPLVWRAGMFWVLTKMILCYHRFDFVKAEQDRLRVGFVPLLT
jgi:hypothetical protein